MGYRIRPHDKTVSKANLTQAVVPVSALKPKHWRTYAARMRIARCPINTTITFQPYLGDAATGSIVQVRNYMGGEAQEGRKQKEGARIRDSYLFFCLGPNILYQVTVKKPPKGC